VSDLEHLEKDRKFLIRIANELESKAKALRKYAENNDYYGVWLTSLTLSTLLEHLDEFVEEKRKQKSKEEVVK